jgi:hypothetical protein
MMRLLLSLTLTWSFVHLATAQVAIDSRVVLTGSSEEQRQVLGLPPSLLSGDVLTGAIDRSGALSFAAATTSDPQTWLASIEGLGESIVPGTHVLIEVPENSGGPITLNINGSGAIPVVFRGGTALSGGHYEVGHLLSLVHDGASFQIMNGSVHRRRDCPPEMVQVNESFCIDVNEQQTPLIFFDAVLFCMEQNKRMCTWGEWHVACTQRTALGLEDMTNNSEWTNNTANMDNAVRMAGPACTTAGHYFAEFGPRDFRCCKQR